MEGRRTSQLSRFTDPPNKIYPLYSWSRGPPEFIESELEEAFPYHCVTCMASKDYNFYERIFLIISTLSLVGIVSVMFYSLLSSYINKPIMVSIDNGGGSLKGDVFPAVTICNLNWRNFHVDTFVYNEVKEDAEWVLRPADNTSSANVTAVPYVPDQLKNSSDVVIKTSLGHINATHLYYNATLLRNVTIKQHEKAKMILKCTWRNAIVNCSEIFKPIITEMGVCSTFNYGFPEKSLAEWYAIHYNFSQQFVVGGVGLRNGLGVILDTKEGRNLQEYDAVGFRIVVHHPSEVPLESRAFLVAPGTATSAKIYMRKTVTMPAVLHQWPASNNKRCFTDQERQLRHYMTYSASNCFMECARDAIREQCHCILPAAPTEDDDNSTICISTEDTDCARNVIDHLQVSDDKKFKKIRAKCRCWSRCTEISYGATISAAQFPGKDAIPKLIKDYNRSEEYIRENFLQLQVYFGEMRYLQYTRDVSSTVAGLLGNMGGVIGMILGFSALTITESAFIVFRRRRARKQKSYQTNAVP